MSVDLVQGLNDPQKAAVERLEGPVLILAGAGSGKTRVITHRIANLILNKRTDSICALTFTNKAAAEMLERVAKLVPSIPWNVQIKTFHSLCLYILRRETSYLGMPSGFTVYDSVLQESLIKQVIKDLHEDPKQYKPSSLTGIFSSWKDGLSDSDSYIRKENFSHRSQMISNIYEEYEKRKKKNQALDFGDLIQKTVELFKENPGVLKSYQDRWNYIMVDEYQDTNKAQYTLVRLLSGERGNLCVVGDDDQSIYSWRGADISNILNFESDFPNAYVVKLEENYRSTSRIIRAASKVIANNSGRKEKELFTNNELGEPISVSQFENETEEAYDIVKKIRAGSARGADYKDFAIFYRTNAQSRYFEEGLRSSGIPYKIFGGFRFFDRAEIKDMIAYLNVIANPMDSTSLLRIVNTPPRGIGEASIEKIRTFSLDKGISFLEAIGHPDLPLKKASLGKAKELYHLFEDLIDRKEKGELPSKIALEIVERSGWVDYMERNLHDEEAVSRVENVREFVNSIEEYESREDSPNLEEYLNQISLLTSEEDSAQLTDYVHLMTVHNAKGLEFPTVFITGLEEGTFPHFMSLEEPNGQEEERRLFYVALTRARQKLYLSYSRTSRKFGKVEDRIPSRFLPEIPSECFGEEGILAQKGVRRPQGPPVASSGAYKIPETSRETRESENSSKPLGEEAAIREGDRVKHAQFGLGHVISIQGTGKNRKVKIKFGSLEKNFFLAYTPLEKL
ncbi:MULTISPECIES: ATP-dependent helicase [unclassified Leptospira]|uniref:ATP-dependent helicase n=1 Tax=unclassified Leptospira TaxID=2633828 RepID=UPI0002BFDBD0|nr:MULTISPECIES: UvrD-helicase domain-containing protein [unclassified Leptospira]EMJ96977.1 putative ATP-dependent helicase PcrA [Leptospira sp. B5-022]MCR1794544.1 UvrD-helicase domain-containing protein [Leptospira sp. id769339]